MSVWLLVNTIEVQEGPVVTASVTVFRDESTALAAKGFAERSDAKGLGVDVSHLVYFGIYYQVKEASVFTVADVAAARRGDAFVGAVEIVSFPRRESKA